MSSSKKTAESSSLAERYVDIAQVILLSLDTDGRVRMINPRGCNLIGLPREAIVGSMWFNTFVPEEDRERTVQGFQSLLRGDPDTARQFENRVLTENGSVRLVAWSNSLHIDEDGEIIGTISSGMDVTEKRNLEVEQEKTAEQYRAFFEYLPIGCYRSLPGGNVLDINPALMELLRIPDREALDLFKTSSGYIHPDDHRTWRNLMDTYGKVTAFETRLRRFDGSPVWVRENARAVYDDSGEIAYFEGTVEDISELKSAESRIRDIEKQYRKFSENVHDVIYRYDIIHDRFEFVSPSILKLTGYSQEQLHGKPIRFMRRILHRSDVRRVFNELYHRIRQGGDTEPLISEYRVICKDGSIIWVGEHRNFECSEDGTVTHMNGVIREITERKRAERELEKQRKELAERVKELNCLHEISKLLEKPDLTPADIVHGTSDLLASAMQYPESAGVRIVIAGQNFDTERFRKTTCMMEEDISVSGRNIGAIIVSCEMKDTKDSPFLREERDLVRTVAERLGRIIEQQQTKDALVDSEERLRTLTENMTVGVFRNTPGPEGRFLEANSTLVEMLGYDDKNELLQHSVADLYVNPEERKVFSDTLMEKDRVDNYEIELRKKNGGSIIGSVSAVAVRGTNNRLLHFDGIVQDITDWKIAQINLREQELRFRSLFEGSPSGIIIHDDRELVIDVNPAFTRIFGYSREESIGKPINSLVAPVDRMDEADCLSRDSLDGRIVHTETKRRHKNGSLVDVDVIGYPVEIEGRTAGVFGIYTDIGERKTAERELNKERKSLEKRVDQATAELREAYDDLERAARLKEEFMSSVSHELRTPLNAILGMSESLAEEVYGPCNEKQLESIERITENGRSLLAMITDILDYTKLGAGKVRLETVPVAVEPLCRSALTGVRKSAREKGLSISTTYDSAVEYVTVDQGRFRQILKNLLDNAVKFTDGNGTVGLEVSGDQSREIVQFTVWDSGIGIRNEDMDLLFKPFVQVDGSLARKYGGTGLGLAMTRHLVELHMGSITVESEPEKGSRFTVAIPWHPSGEDDGDIKVDSGEQGDATMQVTCGKVLLVDDNPESLQTVSEYLKAKGYSLSEAGNGNAAILKAQQDKPDIILMDIQMPGMDGIEATKRIKNDEKTKDIPIIALTALAMPGDKERCMDAGADDYLSKPVSLKTLVKTIEKHLHEDDLRSVER